MNISGFTLKLSHTWPFSRLRINQTIFFKAMELQLERHSGLTVAILANIPTTELLERINSELASALENDLAKSLDHLSSKQKVALEHVLKGLKEEVFAQASKEFNLRFTERCDVAEQKIVPSEGLSFRIYTSLYPNPQIDHYHGLHVAIPDYLPSKREVDLKVEALRRLKAELTPLDDSKNFQKGDTLSIEYQIVKKDDELSEKSKKRRIAFDIFSGVFPKEIEIQLAKAQFNQEIIACSSEGVTYRIVVFAAKRKLLPKVDREFLDSLGVDCETEEQLRELIRQDLAKHGTARERGLVENQLLEVLIEKNNFDIPEELVEDTIRKMIEEDQGEPPTPQEVFLSRAKLWKVAKLRAKEELLIDRIIEQESLDSKDLAHDKRSLVLDFLLRSESSKSANSRPPVD